MNRSGKRLWNLHELARIVDGILLEPTHCCWRKPLTTNADLIPKRPLKKWGACVTTPANVSVQLAILGIFFTTHSAVLIEDVPLTDKDIYADTNPQRIYDLYNNVGYNCFIAAAVYILFGAFACCQMRLNKQKELVH
ncbi:ribonuclease kappa-A isoform X1 [Acanthopagrus latus]|uniref:ribonuclease kappa-A isoform X1 n=1 Tax=Acanthopagrus latus TaxID=8177 RepID=UPI00187CA912|nr:ribonuclease kappa-A isoform X1 [Acanthopagrus latus]